MLLNILIALFLTLLFLFLSFAPEKVINIRAPKRLPFYMNPALQHKDPIVFVRGMIQTFYLVIVLPFLIERFVEQSLFELFHPIVYILIYVFIFEILLVLNFASREKNRQNKE